MNSAPVSPLSALARELGDFAARVERDLKGRFDVMEAALRAEMSAVQARAAEMELRAERAERRVADSLATVKDGEPGRDADPVEIERLVSAKVLAAVAALPPAAPGRDADPVEIERLIDVKVVAAVAALPPAEPGRDADPVEIERLVSAKVVAAVAGLPPAAPGRDADPVEIEQLVSAKVLAAVAALPPAEPGEPGAAGKLPAVRTWSDGVHYAGDVVTHDGSTYQAARDTGREPPHTDWVCLASAGKDGRSFNVRGTWDEIETYAHLDVVALNGAGFVARRDAPGACPGEGWQMIASQGKRGLPGESKPGKPGDLGPPGPPVAGVAVDEMGMLTLTNGDGSAITCDLYPLLSKLRV